MKSISKGEKVAVTIENENGNFVVALNQATGLFSIYRVENKEYTKLGKGKNPLDLEEKYTMAGKR